MMKHSGLLSSFLIASIVGAASQTKPAPPKPPVATESKPSPVASADDTLRAGLAALDAKNFDAALKSFTAAFSAGEADGAFYLARMTELGVGVEPDAQKARLLYLAAADKGSAKAMNRIGLMAYRGEGVLQDYEAARAAICKGADLGDADAAFNCAGLLMQGQGGPKEPARALAHYEKAAASGHIGALNGLGIAYRDGSGVEKDPGKARASFEKAAAKGNPVALYELAAMAEAEGQAVKAHMYFNLAAARQHPQAAEALQRVTAAMNLEDVARAQADARAWKATP